MNLGENFELFLEGISGLMVIDANGKLVYMNQQCADYIRKDQKKSIGKDIEAVFPPTKMRDLLKGNKAFNTNFYFEDGRMSVSTQVQLKDDGKVVGVLEYDMMQNIDSLDDFLDQYSDAMRAELKYYREQIRKFQRTTYSINSIIGSSKAIVDLRTQIEMAAQSKSTVVITGETGTGKELVAHAIHNLSGRGLHRFVKVNAAGLPLQLAESELFGYEEGAFTGAKKGGKKGKFELADKGTLFIDEISQLSIELQPKLLRTLQEGEVDIVGSEKNVFVDVRIIVATNEDLLELVKNGEFRQDLYYRLNVFPITVPPLRNRKTDIPELVEEKIKTLNEELGKNVNKVDTKVYDFFQSYNWPGNVRELYNMLERAMNYVRGDTLSMEQFNWRCDNGKIDLKYLSDVDNPIEIIKREAEKKLILEALSAFGGNKTKTAKYLKIARPLLYQKIKRLGITESDGVSME